MGEAEFSDSFKRDAVHQITVRGYGRNRAPGFCPSKADTDQGQGSANRLTW